MKCQSRLFFWKKKKKKNVVCWNLPSMQSVKVSMNGDYVKVVDWNFLLQSSNCGKSLTFSMLGKNPPDNILKYFSYISQKIDCKNLQEMSVCFLTKISKILSICRALCLLRVCTNECVEIKYVWTGQLKACILLNIIIYKTTDKTSSFVFIDTYPVTVQHSFHSFVFSLPEQKAQKKLIG